MSDDEWSDDGYAERTAVACKYEAAELEWFVTHYEAIQELYGAFRDAGEATFGNWFFQKGGFHHFVHFVYQHSELSSKP
jgi:hypothetical protein